MIGRVQFRQGFEGIRITDCRTRSHAAAVHPHLQLPGRARTFFPQVLDQFRPQYEHNAAVELLDLGDNKTMTVGESAAGWSGWRKAIMSCSSTMTTASPRTTFLRS
jgi:hypothetical protein